MSQNDQNLPKATVNQYVKEQLGDLKFSQEYLDYILILSKEYVKQISSEANEICKKDGKKTIAAEYIFKSLKKFGIDDQIEQLREQHKMILQETEIKQQIKAQYSNAENLKEFEAKQAEIFQLCKSQSLQNNQSLGNDEKDLKLISTLKSEPLKKLDSSKLFNEDQNDEDDYKMDEEISQDIPEKNEN